MIAVIGKSGGTRGVLGVYDVATRDEALAALASDPDYADADAAYKCAPESMMTITLEPHDRIEWSSLYGRADQGDLHLWTKGIPYRFRTYAAVWSMSGAKELARKLGVSFANGTGT